MKIGLSPIGKMNAVCTLLINARTCWYDSVSSSYFIVDPPYIDEYFFLKKLLDRYGMQKNDTAKDSLTSYIIKNITIV